MASRIRQGAFGNFQKSDATDGSISKPMLVFTDADTRDDLYALGKPFDAIDTQRPPTSDGTSRGVNGRKKPHLAELVLDGPAVPSLHKMDDFVRQPPTSNSPFMSAGIGVALGSPSQSPWTYSDIGASSTSLDTRGHSPLSNSVPSPAPLYDENFRDRGKWKMFGALFAKKAASNPVTPGTPFYKAQYPKPTHQAQQLPVAPAGPPKHRRVASRSLDHIPGSVSHYQAQPVSSGWRPVQLPRKSSMKRRPSAPPLNQIRSPTPPPKDHPPKSVSIEPKVTTIEPQREIPRPTINHWDGPAPLVTPAKSTPKPTLLEISIPDVAMERYSIMFSDVLKPRQSLLQRRQGQLSHLKMIENVEESEDKPPQPHVPVRRATAPSPTFSLFPLPPTRNGPPTPNPPVPGSLHRSATAPPASPLPMQRSHQNFPQRQDSRPPAVASSPSQSSETPASLHEYWQSELSPVSTVASEAEYVEGGQPRAPSFFMRLSQSSVGSQDEVLGKAPGKEIDDEQPTAKPTQLQLISHLPIRPNENKNPSEFGYRASPLPQKKELPTPAVRRQQSLKKLAANQAKLAGVSQQTTPDNFRQIVQPNPLKSAPATATEISVARKLSLSRRQQMLVPVTPKTARQPQQPMLVNPHENHEMPTQGPKRSPSRAREKSQYIVLDTV